MSITDSEKDKILSQILKSPEFQDSKRYQELLRYLVDKSVKVTSLKETEIAVEYFGKDSKFDPSTDPLIRSYVSNLRKKLEHYYLTTEDDFDFKLDIPKGHYLIKYVDSKKTGEPKEKFNYAAYIYPVIIVLLVGGFIILEIGKQTQHQRLQKNHVQKI
jgi:hypothetical protein